MKSFYPIFMPLFLAQVWIGGKATTNRITELYTFDLMGQISLKLKRIFRIVTDIQMLQADICTRTLSLAWLQLGEHINDDAPFQLFVNTSGILHDEETTFSRKEAFGIYPMRHSKFCG